MWLCLPVLKKKLESNIVLLLLLFSFTIFSRIVYGSSFFCFVIFNGMTVCNAWKYVQVVSFVYILNFYFRSLSYRFIHCPYVCFSSRQYGAYTNINDDDFFFISIFYICLDFVCLFNSFFLSVYLFYICIFLKKKIYL